MPNLEATFRALSDPTRLAVVQRLAAGPVAVSDLARPFEMALPSFTQHLGVLEEAGLIRSRRDGRSRVCSLESAALQAAEDFLAATRAEWEARMDRFAAHTDTLTKDETDD